MEIPLAGGSVALVDEEDYEELTQWKWGVHTQGYACRKFRSQEPGKKWGRVFMHRLILDAQPGEEVDHINRNKLDNRRANLRIVPHYVNTHNRSSGSGVHKPKGRNRWKAIIYINNQRHWLGSFATEAEAQEAYDRAKREAGLIAQPLWGTPTSRDHKDGSSVENVPENGLLGRQVVNDARMWRTPRVEGFDAGKHRGKADSLHSVVKMLPTAQARDWKGPQGRAYKGESEDLPSTVAQAGMKLNSAWVSRMMGYPDSWMDVGEVTR
jgi:hypothetical protein